MTKSDRLTTFSEFVAAIVADESRAVRLIRAMPGIARARAADERLVREVPHQLYVGDTALHVAAAALGPLAVAALIEAGADSNARNRRGASALHYACDARPGTGKTWNPSKQRAVIELLLDAGSDIEHTRTRRARLRCIAQFARGVPRPSAVSSSAALVWTPLTADSARPLSTLRRIPRARAARKRRAPSSKRSWSSSSDTEPILARATRMTTSRGFEISPLSASSNRDDFDGRAET